jgi:hypothetical protein
MNPLLAIGTGERMVERRSQSKGGDGVDSDRELMLEDASSISERLWSMAQLAQEAVESLDGRIEEEDLTGMVEAVEAREARSPASAATFIEVGGVRRHSDPRPLPTDGRDRPHRRCE